MTFHTDLATFRTATVHDAVVRGPAGPSGCERFRVRAAVSDVHANNTLTTTSTAVSSPGPRAPPSLWVKEPSTAPMLTPRLVAADNQPNARARCAGGMVSATYACATPVVPPPNPCTMRHTNNNQRVLANPNIK